MKHFPSLLWRIGLVVLGIASLLATVHVLPARFARVPVVDDKLAALRATDAPYDILFVGSSRVYRHVSPGIFDHRLEQLGHPLRSFNVGVFGMRIVESYKLFQRIVQDPRIRPRWVIIEADGFFERIEEENLRNPRTLYWHDVEGTTLAAATVDPEIHPLEPDEVAVQRLRHFQAAAYHASNAGTWASHLAGWIGVPGADAGPRPVKRHGFRPLPRPSPDLGGAMGRRVRNLTDRLPAYHREVARYAERAAAARPLEGIGPEVLRRIAGTAKKADVELVFLMSPLPGGRPSVVATVRQEELGPILDFSDPERYPELFALENRFDWGHLTVDGARLFSDRLARRFAALLDERDATP